MERKRRVTALVLLVLVLLATGVVAWWLVPPQTWATWRDYIEQARTWSVDFLSSIPGPLYFLAFAILPSFGIPLSIFYLTALPVLGGTHTAIGISLALLALFLNMVLTKLLTHGIFLPVIEWTIRHRDLEIPKIRRENELKIVVATRISPLPFAIQNYLLALGHARWRTYLWLSLFIQGAIGIVVMMVGESILTGGFGYALLAIFLFLVVSIALQSLRNRLARGSAQPAS